MNDSKVHTPHLRNDIVPPNPGLFYQLKQRLNGQGEVFPFILNVLRLLACLALLGVSILALIRHQARSEDKQLPAGLIHSINGHATEYISHSALWLDIGMCTFYVSPNLALVWELPN